MNSQLFYFLNAVFAVLFLAWFLSSRGEKGTKLRMKRGNGEAPGFREPEPAGTQPVKSEPRNVNASPDIFSRKNAPPAAKNESKALQIFFLYNGHDWDAYEVLGLPAGASLPMVTERYQSLIRAGDSGKLQFYEAAYQAILKKR